MIEQQNILYRWIDEADQSRTSIYYVNGTEEDMDDLRAYIEKHGVDHRIHVSAVVDADIQRLKLLQ